MLPPLSLQGKTSSIPAGAYSGICLRPEVEIEEYMETRGFVWWDWKE